MGRLHRPQAIHEALPQLCRPSSEVFILDDLQRSHGHRRRQGVAAEGRAVVSRLKHVHDGAICEEGTHREDPATERLAQRDGVGSDARMLEGKHSARPSQSGLNLIQDHQHIVLGAECPHLREVALRRHNDAPLRLDWLKQHRGRIGRDGRFDGIGVTEGNALEAWSVRPKAGVVLLLRGEAHKGRRSAMKVTHSSDDLCGVRWNALDGVGPLPSRLDGRLYRLCSGVHRQRRREARQATQFREKRPKLIVEEGPGGECQAIGLRLECRDDVGMAVALIERRVAGEHVQIATPLRVLNPGAARTRDDDR